jgi:hypothetical protein
MTTLIALAAGAASLAFGTAFAATGCAPPASAPQICLTGTIMSAKVNVAMVERAGSLGVVGLHLGETILDWRIVEIAPKFVKLGQGAQIVTLDLSGVVPAADPAPAAAPIKQGPMLRMQGWAARGEREPPK